MSNNEKKYGTTVRPGDDSDKHFWFDTEAEAEAFKMGLMQGLQGLPGEYKIGVWLDDDEENVVWVTCRVTARTVAEQEQES